MKCQRCSSERIAEVDARCKDMFKWKSDKTDYEGYAYTPGGEIGDGDNVYFKYCLECGQIQDKFPTLREWNKDDNEDED